MSHTPTVEHKDGIPWWDAPLPPEQHVCQPQTTGCLDTWGLERVQRCACGAIRSDTIPRWAFVNERRQPTPNPDLLDLERKQQRQEELREAARALRELTTGWLIPVAEWLDKQLTKLGRKKKP